MINPLDSTSGTGSGLSLNSESAGYLKETGGWARFLAILGFIFVGLFVILAFFVGGIMSAAGMGGVMAGMEFLVTIIYLALAALYFFPILYLFRFATNVLDAVKANDTATLTVALSNLKSHYKFIGILTAIFVGLYGVILLITLFAGLIM